MRNGVLRFACEASASADSAVAIAWWCGGWSALPGSDAAPPVGQGQNALAQRLNSFAGERGGPENWKTGQTSLPDESCFSQDRFC